MKIIRVINYILIIIFVYITLMLLSLIYDPTGYFIENLGSGEVYDFFTDGDVFTTILFSVFIFLIMKIIIYLIISFFFDKTNTHKSKSFIIKNIIFIFIHLFFIIFLIIVSPWEFKN